MNKLGPPEHDDIRGRFAGVPGANRLEYLVLVDPLIEAELDVLILAPGSLEPLTADVLEELHKGEPVPFNQLASKLGLDEGPPRRVLAEIIAALERSQDITVTSAGEGEFFVRRMALRKALAVRTFFQLQTVQFVPAARFMALKIPAQNRHQLAAFERENPTVSLWEHGWPDLYEDSALKSAIERTYEAIYRPRFGRVDGANEYRDETLQRSQLLPTRERVSKARAIKVTETNLVMYHRCYLYPKKSEGKEEWNVIVRRYPTGGEQFSYTRYLANRCRCDPDFLSELRKRACPMFH